MPHLIERATSARATCRGCGAKIAKGELRFGEQLPNPFADGENALMTHWFHVACAAYRRPEAFIDGIATSSETIDDRPTLEHEAALGVAHRRLPRVSTADHAPTGRATCRACKNLIEKGAWRIALVFYEEGRFTPSGYLHATCAKEYLETGEFRTRLKHFSPALTDAELNEIAG